MRDFLAVWWIVVFAITSQLPRLYANHLGRQPASRVLVIPLSSISAQRSPSSTRNTQSLRRNAHNALTSLLTRSGTRAQILPAIVSLQRRQSLQSSLPRLPAGITANDITRQILLNQIINDIRKSRPQPTPGVLLNNPPINLEPKKNSVTPSPPPKTTQKPLIIDTGAGSRIKEIRTVNGQTQIILNKVNPFPGQKRNANKKNNLNPFQQLFNPTTLKPGEDPPEPELSNIIQALGRQMGMIP